MITNSFSGHGWEILKLPATQEDLFKHFLSSNSHKKLALVNPTPASMNGFVENLISKFLQGRSVSESKAKLQISLEERPLDAKSRIVVNRRIKQVLEICYHSPTVYQRALKSHTASFVLRIQRSKYTAEPSVTGSCRECKGLWKKETGTDSDGSTTFISTLSSQDGNLMENAFAIARRLLQRVVGLNTASMTDSFISASALTGPCSEDLPEDLVEDTDTLRPSDTASPFYDAVEKGLTDAICAAFKKVRESGNSEELVRFGIDIFDVLAKYNNAHSK
ncbi:hypothetical protein AAVH_12239 [Aphelenchoides avenae]|nr:hypothetical protein AAVH_12239 [Aphelenchus avenae]